MKIPSELKMAIQSKNCPIHNIRPYVKINNAQITIRCCCDYFTRQCINDINSKLGENASFGVIDAWEKDLSNNSRSLELI